MHAELAHRAFFVGKVLLRAPELREHVVGLLDALNVLVVELALFMGELALKVGSLTVALLEPLAEEQRRHCPRRGRRTHTPRRALRRRRACARARDARSCRRKRPRTLGRRRTGSLAEP
eukprot:Amastigsp_a514943_12.p2 type:complete len:119 gc:universal Amastigsp_a514943_12:500-856(+)